MCKHVYRWIQSCDVLVLGVLERVGVWSEGAPIEYVIIEYSRQAIYINFME